MRFAVSLDITLAEAICVVEALEIVATNAQKVADSVRERGRMHAAAVVDIDGAIASQLSETIARQVQEQLARMNGEAQS